MNALMVFVGKGRCVPVLEISSKPTSDQFKLLGAQLAGALELWPDAADLASKKNVEIFHGH